MSTANLWRRCRWLLGCLLVGSAAGLLGQVLTGTQLGYLVIPFGIAIGWLFVADPTQCLPTGGRDSAADRDRGRGPLP